MNEINSMSELNHYKNLEKLHENSTVRIYRAFDDKNNRSVILKISKTIHPGIKETTKFYREFEIAGLFSDEGVIKIYEIKKLNDSITLVMEDIKGQSLNELLVSEKLSMDDFLTVAIAITDIIGNIHKRHIIHKNITPSNIIWNKDKKMIRIIDFGISTELARQTNSIKSTHALEGTAAYISPEQTGRMNRCIDYRTDFYSLGITFYWMLAGRLPFETTDLLQLVHSHIAIKPVSLHKIEKNIPRAISNIVMKLMAKNAEDRYQSAYGLKIDLIKCQKQLKEEGIIKIFELGLSDISDKFQIPQKLYGRTKEIDSLMSAFLRISQNNKEFMLVSGFSGIGKSLLINEISIPVVQHNGYFVAGKFEKLQKDVPYSAIVQVFTGIARQILGETQIEFAAWKKKLLTALGPNGKIITDMMPVFERIIGKQAEIPVLEPVQSQNRFNLVFASFLKTLAQKEHPLVIFLDDLQWADSDSLHLLKLFMIDPGIKHLLILGAYRHNGINDTHPLFLTVHEIEKCGGKVNQLSLQPLDQDHVNQLVADTLHRSVEETASLSTLLIHKTGGNPFFVKEFLRYLYTKKVIDFSFEQGWSWDIDQIEKSQASDIVMELLTEQITALPENSQDILKLSACIGSEFDLNTLSVISEKSEEYVFKQLSRFLQEGLVSKVDNKYRFRHDRILEFAYSLNSEQDKICQHYRIGNLVLNNSDQSQLSTRIFYVVNQLNAGIALFKEKKDRLGLAKLNHMAGKKALVSNAYASALNYFKQGIELLDHNPWIEQYEFSLELHQKAVVSAQLNADYKTMEILSQDVFKNARTILDKIDVYQANIFACIAQNRLSEGIRTGLNVLDKLGIKIPEKPGKMRVLCELLRIKTALTGKSIESLVSLPEMKDPHKLAIMQIISSIGTITYYAAPELVVLLVLKGVWLSFKNGSSIYSPYCYAAFGVIHCGVFGDIDAGYSWGKLALDIVEKFNIKQTKSRTMMAVWYVICHWKQHLRDSVQPLLEAYQTGLETGDLEFAALSANSYSNYFFFSGAELVKVEKMLATYEEAIKHLHQDTILNYKRMDHQTVLNLLGKSENPCKLIGSCYDQSKMLPVHERVNDTTALFVVYGYLLNLNYLFENYSKALEYANKVKPYCFQQISHPIVPVINFYDSLTCLALYSTENNPVKKSLFNQVRQNQKKMKKLARHAPMNYNHKYHLIEAEIARIHGKELKARHHYHTAINLAHENKFLQEEALAWKLFAKFWLEQNEIKIAALYMAEARDAYQIWGAVAVVAHLEEKYKYLFDLKTDRKLFSSQLMSTSTARAESIDLSTIIKSSQAISSEIDLGRLLKGILKFSMENAGAQKGFLIIENEENKNLYIEAEGEFDKAIKVLESIPIENHPGLSSSIVHYVKNTSENVVLHHAHKQGGFTHDPYIITNKIKSLLCFPITHKAKTSGILYLENNISTNSFTDERIKLLGILSSQAAISIENARLLLHRENTAKLNKEMEIAVEIQTGLLPKDPSINGYEIAAYMSPADDVGGDYYDVINTGKMDWVIIGDVSGHGVSAGLVMMMAQTAIHVVLSQHPDLSPSELLKIINKTITENIMLLKESKYMTITAFAIYDNGTVKFSGLHQDILIYRNKTNTVEIVKSDGMWIGILDNLDDVMKDDVITLDFGDTMLVYTDGLTEARKNEYIQDNSKAIQEMFGETRLEQVLAQYGSESPIQIKNKILDHLQDYDCIDDVTLVLLKRI